MTEEVKEEKPVIQEEESETEEDEEKSLSMIQKANLAAERLENSNKQLKQLLDRQEQLQIKTTLGGQAVAGSRELTPDEIQTQEVTKMFEGTGINPFDGEGANAISQKKVS